MGTEKFLVYGIDRGTLRGLVSVTLMQGATNSLLPPTSLRMVWKVMLLIPLLLGAIWATPLHAGMPKAQKHEYRREIFQLENAWRDAILRGNVTTLDRLMADDYLAITSSGALQTKEQTLAYLRSGQLRFTSLQLFDRKIRFYGKTALVTSMAEARGTTPEGVVSGRYRYTRVYVQDPKGEWKIVSFEASRIHRLHKLGGNK